MSTLTETKLTEFKLTETQLVVLSTAAGRDGGAVLPLAKTLKINKGASSLVLKSLLAKGLIAEVPGDPAAPFWREDDVGRRFALTLSAAGAAAIGIEAAEDACMPDAPQQDGAQSEGARAQPAGEITAPLLPAAIPSARVGTKQALLIGLLRRPEGATIAEIGAATGWLPHSVRGVISGGLKKKLGLAVVSEKEDDRGRVYRIAEGA